MERDIVRFEEATLKKNFTFHTKSLIVIMTAVATVAICPIGTTKYYAVRESEAQAQLNAVMDVTIRVTHLNQLLN